MSESVLGTSALVLFVGQVTTDRVIEAFKAAPKSEIIASNLSPLNDIARGRLRLAEPQEAS
jgi:hypothetical protein